jgi:hypothetical protein
MLIDPKQVEVDKQKRRTKFFKDQQLTAPPETTSNADPNSGKTSSSTKTTSKDVSASSKDVSGASATAQSSSKDVASSSRTSSGASSSSPSQATTTFDIVFAKFKKHSARVHEEMAAKKQTAERNQKFLEELGLEFHLPYELGPLLLEGDPDHTCMFKLWTRACKAITSGLKIPFVFERELAPEIRDPKKGISRRRTKTTGRQQTDEPNPKITPAMEKILTGVTGGDLRTTIEIWTTDAAQSLVLPPPCSWYNGWPKRLYAFHHLHRIQELNISWSEFLYARVPIRLAFFLSRSRKSRPL